MSSPVLDLSGNFTDATGRSFTTMRLDAQRHIPWLLQVFEEAGDYVDLEWGTPPTAAIVEAFLLDRPPSSPLEAKCTLGVVDGNGAGVGVLDMLRGYPQADDLYIGLLMLVPRVRSGGLGHVIIDWLAAEARNRGIRRLLTGPVASNTKGRAFWEREGFELLRKVPDSQTGAKTHTVYVVAKDLTDLT